VFGGAAILAAAASLLLMMRAPGPLLRAKGGLALDVLRKRGAGPVEELVPPAEVRPRDALRFRLSAPRPGFAAVVSIDGAQKVSSYFPAAERLPAVPRGKQLLDGGIELDATPGRERLIALVCPQPLLTADVRTAVARELDRAGDARKVDPKRALPDCAATSFWLDKVALTTSDQP
jgi:hypothetical protein